MNSAKTAHLVLQDDTVFTGMGFGFSALQSGEVVFNTAHTGYQEILTDPSYAGQIVVMTCPHIGNYGVNAEDVESHRIFASGFVVREISRIYSNHRGRETLHAYLKRERLPCIAEIDTRALVRHIREQGAMPAVLACGTRHSVADLKKMAKNLSGMEGQNLAKVVSCQRPYVFRKKLHELSHTDEQVKGERAGLAKKGEKQVKKYHVVAYDFGAKHNILRLLNEAGCSVTVVPYYYDAQKILNAKKNVDGVFLSNGPGDPAACEEVIRNVRLLLGKKPIFGVCLGHQILALALGARTYKLKFGHHGANQPVKELATGRVEITSQNHGFAVDPQSLPPEVEVTHVHLNDQTISGIAHKSLPAFAVQYHPEASPGPHDSRYLFKKFVEMMHAQAH